MNSNEGKQKFFVIYQITNLIDNKIYLGAHVTYNINDKYMGSSKYLKKDIKELGRQNFRKDILHIFDNKEDMISKEAELVNREFCHREDTYNRMIGGISDWSVLGMVAVKDKNGNNMLVYKDDPRYISGELISNMKGIAQHYKFLSKDINNNNIFLIDKNDKRWLSGELVGFAKGLPQHINSNWNGRKHKEESKQKQSEKAKLRTGEKNSQFGTCWITKENENKKIKKEDLKVYLQQGWIKGRKYGLLSQLVEETVLEAVQ